MLTAPNNTLAFHTTRVLCQRRDMSDTPCANLAKKVEAFRKADQNSYCSPEAEALSFYGMNAGMAMITARYDLYEPLPPKVLEFVEAYHTDLVKSAVRAFYYLVLICTREARHHHTKDAHYAALTKAGYTVEELAWYKGLKGKDSHSAPVYFQTTPPPMTVGRYTKMIRDAFYVPSSWPNSYGGQNWGKVTDCLVNFVDGTFSAEMMLDTNWTLAHNTGPIFNKGMMYKTQENVTLLRILDVQRGGQVPEAILFDKTVRNHARTATCSWMKWLAQEFPSEVGSFVDWIKVKELGAVGNYPFEINEQKKNDPDYIAKEKKAKEEAEAKALAAVKAAEEAAAKEAASWYVIDPWNKVKKIEREAA